MLGSVGDEVRRQYDRGPVTVPSEASNVTIGNLESR